MTAKRDAEDEALLRHAFRDVKPLKGRVIGKKAEKKKVAKVVPPPAPRAPTAKPKAILLPLPAQKAPAKPVMPELTMGHAAGVDLNTVRRLKRGKMPVEGRLDLHGHTQEQAFSALAHFLASMQRGSARTVLIITGKSGVLRREVPRWLNASPNRARILSFAQARIGDGGDGALYVLIRKAKPQ